MSERVAGLVCEGQTDVPILREVIMQLWPEIEEVRALQPEIDAVGRAKGAAGWSLVERWCREHAPTLNDVLDPDVGDPIDLLVVAVDVDIAIDAGIADPPQAIGVYETTRLRDTLTRWLQAPGRRQIPGALVLSTPVMAIEAWVIAAIFPKERSPERIQDGAQFLVDKEKLRLSPKDGTPWKELYKYRDFAPRVAKRLNSVRKSCAEAERTCAAIERRRDSVETA